MSKKIRTAVAAPGGGRRRPKGGKVTPILKDFGVRPGAQFSLAQARRYGAEIYRLASQRNEQLQAQDLVDEARPITSPLHDGFEWDDTTAAEEHRKYQARKMLRQITSIVVISGREFTTPACLNVLMIDNGDGSLKAPTTDVDMARANQAKKQASTGSGFQNRYVTQIQGAKTPSFRQQAISDALGRLERWTEEYRIYEELDALCTAIEKGVLNVRQQLPQPKRPRRGKP